MPPPETPQTVAERVRDVKLAELKAQYLSPDEIMKTLFGSDAAKGSIGRAGWERTKINPEYEREKERVKVAVRDISSRMFDAILSRIDSEQELITQTEAKLKSFSRTLRAMGELIRLRHNPYSDRAREDVMDTSELLELRQFMEQLQQIDTDELVDMVYEDQLYVNMLIESNKVADGKVSQERLLDQDEQGKYPEKYHENIGMLAQFILNDIKEKSDEKSGLQYRSDMRRSTENLLWQEIVRGLTIVQKTDLLAEVLAKGGKAEGEGFLARAIFSKAMSRRDISDIYESQMKPGAEHRRQFVKLGWDEKSADLFLRSAVAAREEKEAMIQQEVEQMNTRRSTNAVQYFFTFNKMGAETIGRVGVLAAVVNIGLKVANKIATKGHHDSWYMAGLKGVAEAATDKYVLGGLAAAAWGANVVFPYAEDVLYAPGDEEKKQLAKTREEEFFRDQVEDHDELADYLFHHYDDLMKQAERNEQNPKRGTFDLWPGDVKISPEEAGQMGYPSAEMAEARVMRLFKLSSRILELKDGGRIDTGKKLRKYMIEQGMLCEHEDEK